MSSADARFYPVARGFAANRTAKTAVAHPKIARYDRLIVPAKHGGTRTCDIAIGKFDRAAPGIML